MILLRARLGSFCTLHRAQGRACGVALVLLLQAACGESSPPLGAGFDATGGSGAQMGSGGVGAGSGGGATGGAGFATGGGMPAAGGSAAGGAASSAGGAWGSGGGMVSAGGSPGGSGGLTGAGGALGSGGDPGATGGTASGGGSGLSPGATIVPDPSWTCGAPAGIVDPELGELVFEASLEVGEVYAVGVTQYGERRVLDIADGATVGAFEATFLNGGLDLELTLTNGAVELEQVNMLRASDGSLIYMRSCGVAPTGSSEVRIIPDFEVANSSSLAWLNTGKFVGTRAFDPATKAIQLAVYDVSDVLPGGAEVKLSDPVDDWDQPSECSTQTGSPGATVFTETVTLGGSLSVGASKRGTRNVIPITGGTVSGRFAGEVLPGGADYQLIAGTTVLDARYVLKSDDGEFVVVRNCGPFGALIPWFEARADGPYAFLNTGEFLSSDPGAAGGGVSITFYERN